MNDLENAKECLESIRSTISNCDNKANAFLTVVGIIFGFSMFSIQELSEKSEPTIILVMIFGILYLLTFLTSIVLLIMIVFPRRKNRVEKIRAIDYSHYTEDLNKHSKNDDLESFAVEDIKVEAVVDQVKICTRIAHTKENLLRASTILLIAFAAFLICLIVCIFI